VDGHRWLLDSLWEDRQKVRINMIYQYNFADGTVLKLIDSGLTLEEIWKLEELHGNCVMGEKARE